MVNFDYDVIIIGGGVIGAAIARELSFYALKIAVLEKEEDVCSGTTKANSAIVHAGHDAKIGTLKAKFNVEGNLLMEELSKELDFDFKRNGSLVLCFHKEDLQTLNELYENGVKNGVKGLKILTGDEARQMENNLTEDVVAALYSPMGGIVCPFGLNIALAENAHENGVEFKFNTEVIDIEKLENGYCLQTSTGSINSKIIVNAAGVYADKFNNMVSQNKIKIIPRKGDYYLLDKSAGAHVEKTIFQLPGKLGKGVLITPTVHGNLLIGPSATDVDNCELTCTTKEDMDLVAEKAKISVKNLPFKETITSFAGVRAHEENDDFIIGEVEDAKGFYNVAGIESPGLSSAPAIGKYMANLIAKDTVTNKKEKVIKERKGLLKVSELSFEERKKAVEQRPDYGTIVCRCENVSEGEIIDCIRRPLGAKSLDGVKRRVRQGAGRCQAGFCTPRTLEILSKELGIAIEEVCKNKTGSEMVKGSI